MKVNIEGTDYWVHWVYHMSPGKQNVVVAKTKCIIETQGFVTLCSEEVGCNPKDRFVKEIGRKLSLKKTLEKQWPNNREIRKQFWIHYLNR